MREFTFNPVGGRLSVRIEFGSSQIGSYILRLWEAGSSTVVLQLRGNNQKPDDATRLLPLPTKYNDGRLIQCQTAIVAPDWRQGEQYSVKLIFQQGDLLRSQLCALRLGHQNMFPTASRSSRCSGVEAHQGRAGSDRKSFEQEGVRRCDCGLPSFRRDPPLGFRRRVLVVSRCTWLPTHLE